MQERLRAEDLPDRRGERRPARLGADRVELDQHVLEAVARAVRAQVRVERRHEPGRDLVLGGAHRDPRRERRDRLVADVLVDEVGRAPERGHVDAGVEPEPGERLRDALAGDAVEREREREDRAGDEVGAGARRLEHGRERAARGALAVDPDREPRRLVQLVHELVRAVRLQRARRVVKEHPRGTELRQLAGLPDERLGLAGETGAVDEPGLERAAGGGDRLGGLLQVRDVVERVVEAEDVDPVLGRARDEAAHEVAVDGPRADEEAARGARARAASSSAP